MWVPCQTSWFWCTCRRNNRRIKSIQIYCDIYIPGYFCQNIIYPVWICCNFMCPETLSFWYIFHFFNVHRTNTYLYQIVFLARFENRTGMIRSRSVEIWSQIRVSIQLKNRKIFILFSYCSYRTNRYRVLTTKSVNNLSS